MRPSSLLPEIVKEIAPGNDERARALEHVNLFLGSLNAQLKRMKVDAKAVLGGSYAKDTWLSGDYDVDVFVKFDMIHKDENLSDILERALRKFGHERIHGSRDYFWVRNDIKYEIVPVLDIKKPSDASNVTDFSPWHVKWVNTVGKKYKDDIRLVKKFCKAAKCYGAESYIRGFSGHVVDILTIHYKGFLNLLKAASKWKPKVVIDPKNAFKGKALLMLNKSKTEGPFVLVDPVQPDRNAAAALTEENLERFISAAKAFLKKPSRDFFVEKEIDFDALGKKGSLVSVDVQTLDDKEDVAGTKFVRAFEHCRDGLSEFGVLDSGWVWDKRKKGAWWFVLKDLRLPDKKDQPGPPVNMADAVKKFKRAHKETFSKSGRVWARVKRESVDARDALKVMCSGEYVRSRVLKAVVK